MKVDWIRWLFSPRYRAYLAYRAPLRDGDKRPPAKLHPWLERLADLFFPPRKRQP